MECIAYLCTEISLNHKRHKFLAMLDSADHIIEDGERGVRERALSNPDTLKKRARTESLLREGESKL